MMTLLASIAPGLPADQRAALTALVLAFAALINALAYNTAEGALVVHRWTLRVAAGVIVVVAVYTAIRLWW